MVRRRLAPATGPIVLDAGAVLAYVTGDAAVRDWCSAAAAANQRIVFPTVVYARVERGWSRRHAATQLLDQLLWICDIWPLSLEIARQAGWLMRDSGTTDVVDAVVVVEAVALQRATILTSDRGDIVQLLSFTADQQRRGVRVVGV
jgi:predicted nucleic acid-binding protein